MSCAPYRDWARTRRWLDRVFCTAVTFQLAIAAGTWLKFGWGSGLGPPFSQITVAVTAAAWASGIAWLVLTFIVKRRARRG
jgi:hypothetical protein